MAVLWLASLGQAQLPELSHNPKHAETVRFLVAAGQANPYLSVASIGRSVRGRELAVVTLKAPGVSALDQVRLLVLCRQHGNEPAGTVAMLELVRDFVAGRLPEMEVWLQRVCVQIVPMVNPDGAEVDQRHNANDADLNRDWTARRQPETRAVEYLYNLWRPHVVIDLHELHWNDQYGVNTVEAPQPGVVFAAIGDEARELQGLILERLRGAGFPVRYSAWDHTNNGTLAHRHFSRDHGSTTLLFESERQNLVTPLARRAAMHRIGILTAIEYYAVKGSSGRRLPRLAMTPQFEAFPPPTTDAAPIGANAAAAVPREPLGPTPPVKPREPSIEVLSPDLSRPVGPDSTLRIAVAGVDDLNYVALRIDGEGRLYTNKTTLDYPLKTAELSDGRHVALVLAHRRNGDVVEREFTFVIDRTAGSE